jgi:hypothetical protein
MIISIDPSDTIHAWAALEGTADRPILSAFGLDFSVERMAGKAIPGIYNKPDFVAIEMVACYGMAAGAHLFDTCVRIGELKADIEKGLLIETRRITRAEVKRLICGRTAANDSNVRAAIIDRFGGPYATKKGGPLYKVSKDAWAAIAVGLAAMDPGVKWYVPAHMRKVSCP